MTLAHQIPEFIAEKIMMMKLQTNPHPVAKIIKKMWEDIHEFEIHDEWIYDYCETWCYNLEDGDDDYDDELANENFYRMYAEIIDGEISKFPMWRKDGEESKDKDGNLIIPYPV